MTVSRKMKSSTLKLSDVARHVKIPSGIVTTGWPAVRDRCRDFGIGFDGWQDGLGRLSLGKRSDGLYAAGIGGVIVSIPRQTGKTYLFGWIVFALCTLFPNLTIVWTAHRTRTSDETFEKMRAMAMKPKVAPFIDGKPRSANGQQTVKFKNGSRILFGAREQGFGRGFDEVDVLVFDEAQILTESALSDMVPATNAAKNGLVLMMGTPPRVKDPGEAFGARREDALAGDPDTVFVEFSADRGSKIIDWDQLAKANPSYPHRTSRTAILRMQKLLGSEDNFQREAYGVWDEESAVKAAIPFSAWRVLKAKKPEQGRVAFGVRFTPDGSTVALAGGVRPDDGPIHVEAFRQENLGEGLGWLVDFLVRRADSTSLIVIDGKSGAGALAQALKDEGITRRGLVVLPTMEQVVSAHAMFLESIKSGGLSHLGQGPLNKQVKDAVRRPIGKSGAFGWDANKGDSVALLEAVTYAFWGAKVARANPGESRSAQSARRAGNRRGR